MVHCSRYFLMQKEITKESPPSGSVPGYSHPPMRSLPADFALLAHFAFTLKVITIFTCKHRQNDKKHQNCRLLKTRHIVTALRSQNAHINAPKQQISQRSRPLKLLMLRWQHGR